MRKTIIIGIISILCFSINATAQSSMTDDQVMKFVAKEHAAGTSNQQIVTKLMQSGVDITQIRRVKKRYESLSKDALGTGTGNKEFTDKDRMRENNGKNRSDYGKEADRKAAGVTDMKVKSERGNYTHTYDKNDEEYLDFQNEINAIIPDSTTMLRQLLSEREKNRHKVFGRDIFNNEELSFEPNMNIATPNNYRLGPGDAVIIDIYGASQKTVQSTVSPDGEVTIEGYGPVQVSGLTVAQANARLRSTLGSRYNSSKIKLTVGQTKTIMVNVMGEVKAPGTYTLSAFATVFHALYMAGGTNDLGTLRNIKVYRNNQLVTVVDIYDYILNGKLTGNVRLADNDVIVIGPYDCLVNISGKVKRPMYYEMKKDESIASLLKYAGGFTGDAYKKSVRVNRKTGREYSVFNVGEFDFSSFRIDDGDSVSIDSILPRYKNTVELKGAVFRPGLYNIGENSNSVRTLIALAEGVTEDAFTTRAVLHRMKSDRTLKVIAVDLEGILSGKSADIPLQENDVLFIPTRRDKISERTITIRGEVQFPGIYKYAENETIEDFILQAGGLTDKASTSIINVARRVNNPAALQPDSITAQNFTLSLKDGFVVDGTPGFTLMPFDEVYVRKSPGYVEQRNVTIEGEVMFSGTYTLTKRNARLSDLFNMAGGASAMAYVKGAKLYRKPTQTERERMETAFKMAIEQQQKNLMQLAAKSNNAGSIAEIAQKNQATQLEKFKVPDEYPVGIDLEEAAKNPGCDEDVILRSGDRLVIPQYNGTVKINGAVMYPNAVAYAKNEKASYYIKQAGGYATDAKKGNAYIIYMNGKVAKLSGSTKILPGSEIVIPNKAMSKMSIAETLSIGTGMASIATMIATIANVLK